MKRYLLIFIIWGLGAVGLVIWKGWEQLAALATWFLVLGIVFAILQVQQMRRSTNAQVAIGLSQKLRDKEVLVILQKIYELEPERIASLPNSTEKKDEQLENEITRVVDNLELLGALVAQGIIDEGMAIVVYGGPTALKCWYKLNEYINELRSGRRHSLCCKYLEDFAARTWERSYRGGQKIYFYRVKEEPTIDLIEYFEKRPELRPKRYK